MDKTEYTDEQVARIDAARQRFVRAIALFERTPAVLNIINELVGIHLSIQREQIAEAIEAERGATQNVLGWRDPVWDLHGRQALTRAAEIARSDDE